MAGSVASGTTGPVPLGRWIRRRDALGRRRRLGHRRQALGRGEPRLEQRQRIRQERRGGLPGIDVRNHQQVWRTVGVQRVAEDQTERAPPGRQRRELVETLRRHEHVGGDDVARAQLPGQLHRQVVGHPAIHQVPPLPDDRCERYRYGHARPDSQRQVAGGEDHRLARLQVCGHGSEPARQAIEVATAPHARVEEVVDQQPIEAPLGNDAPDPPDPYGAHTGSQDRVARHAVGTGEAG